MISYTMRYLAIFDANLLPFCMTNAKRIFAKTKTEHFLDRQMPDFHTYRLGRSNYLTAFGEIAYFYRCGPRLVATIRADSCYDALPVEIACDEYTPTAFVQEDRKEVITPQHYIEPLTHRITSVAKKVPCLSKFFARYKDIFGQCFALTLLLHLLHVTHQNWTILAEMW